nr:retrovirus-related Pol polyprotein from transposon TNT 1-94 [Tanacetum cinerariifolium]
MNISRDILNISPENKAHYEAKAEPIHLILTRIGDEIYSTVDSCTTTKNMWIATERLQQGESLNKQNVKTALRDQEVELAKYKRFNDCTPENDRLERKLKETLGLLAQKEIDSQEVLKTKGYEISMKKEKNNEDDSLNFVHELKQEMFADLEYVRSLEKEVDELESEKANFSNEYDLLLQECVSKDIMCSYLPSLSDLNEQTELQCLYQDKIKECECLANKLSKQTKNFVGKDQFAPILDYGDLVQGNIMINRVYYVKGLNHNLKSVGHFCDADLEVAFRKSTCFVRDLQGNNLLSGNHGSDLYTISLLDTTSPTPICFMAKALPTQAWLWHRRLSHLNFNTINLLSMKDIVIGLPKLKYVNDQLCSSYELGKAKRSTFKTKTVPRLKRRLNLLHIDLYGPMRIESINGNTFCDTAKFLILKQVAQTVEGSLTPHIPSPVTADEKIQKKMSTMKWQKNSKKDLHAGRKTKKVKCLEESSEYRRFNSRNLKIWREITSLEEDFWELNVYILSSVKTEVSIANTILVLLKVIQETAKYVSTASVKLVLPVLT